MRPCLSTRPPGLSGSGAGRKLVYHGSTIHGGRFSASRTRPSRFSSSCLHVGSAVQTAGDLPASLLAQDHAHALLGLSTPLPELYEPLSTSSRCLSSSTSSQSTSAREILLSNLKKQLVEVEAEMVRCMRLSQPRRLRPAPGRPSRARRSARRAAERSRAFAAS